MDFKRPYKPELKVDNKPLVDEPMFYFNLHELKERKAKNIAEQLIRKASRLGIMFTPDSEFQRQIDESLDTD